MINDFEDYTKVQAFGNGFTQWQKGDLAHSAKVCIDDSGVTRGLVRAAFKADSSEFGQVFTKQDANRMGHDY